MDPRASLVSRPYWAERQTAALFLIASTSAVWAKSNHLPAASVFGRAHSRIDSAHFRRSAHQLEAASCASLIGKANWNSDPFLPSDDAVS